MLDDANTLKLKAKAAPHLKTSNCHLFLINAILKQSKFIIGNSASIITQHDVETNLAKITNQCIFIPRKAATKEKKEKKF